MPNFYEERIYLPDGASRDDDEARSFQVGVYYRGEGLYLVTNGASAQNPYVQLSRSGKWLYHPSKMNQMQWCRFEFEEAYERAAAAVNGVKVNGLTWAQWRARHVERR